MSDTELIKDRLDIVQLLGEYVKLKKAGVNWKANCPFHHEKTPSFMVQPEKQIWHCFGCSKGGDIFTFIQEIEGLDFIEALKLLAGRAGVTLDTFKKSEVDQSVRNRLLEINATAALFFQYILTEQPAAARAREYVRQRGLTQQTITDWRIGYAPEQWDLLTKYLLKKGYGIDDVVAAGLTIKRENADSVSGRGFYDRFRGRIMFPISDVHGAVVGFTGRVVVETETSGGKYVNTPQTILYDKSRVVYGLAQAKTGIKAADQTVLVEGQMDVLACHQAGMTNVVAASGTALTPEQIKLLKRYSLNVAIAFDADFAGQKAGERGLTVALAEGMNVKIITVPAAVGKDADECLRNHPAAWFAAVANATEITRWYFEKTFAAYNPSQAKDKQRIAAFLLNRIIELPHAVEREHWLKELSERLGIDMAILRDESKKIARRPSVNLTNRQIGSGGANPTEALDPREALQYDFWSLLFKFPEVYAAQRPAIRSEYFAGTIFNDLYETTENLYTTEGRLEIATLRERYTQAGQENIVEILTLRPYKDFNEISPAQAAQELPVILSRIKEAWRKQRTHELIQVLTKTEQSGTRVQIEQLLHELQTL